MMRETNNYCLSSYNIPQHPQCSAEFDWLICIANWSEKVAKQQEMNNLTNPFILPIPIICLWVTPFYRFPQQF